MDIITFQTFDPESLDFYFDNIIFLSTWEKDSKSRIFGNINIFQPEPLYLTSVKFLLKAMMIV